MLLNKSLLKSLLMATTQLVVTKPLPILIQIKKKTDPIWCLVHFNAYLKTETNWWFQPLWKIWVRLDPHPNYWGKLKNVPNHQPAIKMDTYMKWWGKIMLNVVSYPASPNHDWWGLLILICAEFGCFAASSWHHATESGVSQDQNMGLCQHLVDVRINRFLDSTDLTMEKGTT